MKKAGRTDTAKARREAVVSRSFLSSAVDPMGFIRAYVTLRQGDAITRLHPRTGKPERWVLLSPVDEAEELVGEAGDDWLRNQTRVIRQQRWRAAFVTAVAP